MILKDEFPRSKGVQYATGEEWRRTAIAPERMSGWAKSERHLVVDVSSDKSDAVKNSIA